MKSNILFKKFIIQSIISFLITGGLLTFFVSKSIINQEINHNIEIVSLTLFHSLDHWFKSVDLSDLTEHDIEHLDDEFKSLNELGNIADIRIWNKERELVYSQNKELIGTLELETEHYENAHNGIADYEVSEVNAEENRMLKELGDEFIEIYLPIHDYTNGSLAGVFEVYRSFDQSRDSIGSSIRSIVTILSIGLIILYFFLARTIYNSSNKLISQNKEIKKQANQLEESLEQLNNLYRSVIRAITNAIDARDKFTSGHSIRVAELTIGFAKYLKIISDDVDQLEIAALLHDIGKLGVPESIITKPGSLTDEEYEIIKQHPIIGEKIVHDIEVLHDTIDVIKFHHEHYSGKGYPECLSSDQLPYSARIIALTDAYDAMTSRRPYRKALSKDKAIHEINMKRGTQFDPDLADQFIAFVNTLDL